MILFLILFGIALYVAESYSMTHVLDGVRIFTELDRTVVEPGEAFVWKLVMENGKKCMVPYLKIREQIPEGLIRSDTGKPAAGTGQAGAQTILYLNGGERAELTRKVCLKQRGRYFFHGASVEAGDFLGLQTVNGSFSELREIVVKPEPADRESVSRLLGGYLGEHTVKRSLFEDPVLISGFREYTGREPFRSISWTQSARIGRLLVKEQEGAAEFSCTVLLLVENEKEESGRETLERSFSITRSLCEELEHRRIAYDFQTNGVIAGAMGSWKHVGDGLGAGHLETVLEGLGRMLYEKNEDPESFLFRVLKGVRAGKSLLLVAPRYEEKYGGLLKAMEERSGRKVLTVYAERREGQP